MNKSEDKRNLLVEENQINVPKAEFKGFTPQDQELFVTIFKKALKDMKETGQVNLDLMNESSYPYQNLTNQVREGYKVNAEAYNAFNRFIRKAYELLFPSQLLLTFEDHPLLEEAMKVSRERLSGYLHESRNNYVHGYNINLKRQRELERQGTRAQLPGEFFRVASQELKSGSNQLAERFVKYMGLLLLAAYDMDNTYRVTHGLEARDLKMFLASDTNKDGYILREIMHQIVNENSNFGDLFAIFIHAEEKAKGTQVVLRHYFSDVEGKTLVAKCGFADAFSNHITDIVLANPG